MESVGSRKFSSGSQLTDRLNIADVVRQAKSDGGQLSAIVQQKFSIDEQRAKLFKHRNSVVPQWFSIVSQN